MKRLDIIQALRFFGAIAVFACHTKYLLPSGGYAVELFTVISGYIIIYSTQREQSKKAFLMKRVIRVLPLYWIFTLLMYVLICIRPSLSMSCEATPEYLIKSLFFIPFVNRRGSDLPILGVGWTLNYEMFFYIIFYFAMLVNHKFRALLTIAGSVLLVMAGLYFAPLNFIFQYYTNSFLLEFSMGILAFYVVRYLQPRLRNRYVRFCCGLVSCSAFFWMVLRSHEDAAIPRCIHSGVPAFICVCAAVFAWNEAKIPSILVKLGNMSYSFYLIEIFTAAFCALIIENMTFIMQIMVALVILAVTLVCSYVSYQIIEVQFTGFLKKKLLKPN